MHELPSAHFDEVLERMALESKSDHNEARQHKERRFDADRGAYTFKQILESMSRS
jgi:hypothetical protein